MSVYIKGMEMPGTGRYLIVYPDGRVVDTDIDGESQCIIPGSKAIPVPNHGRLIDADALIAKVTDAAKEQPEIADVYYEEASEIGGWLYSMPTIIPASTADKEGEG